MTSIAEAIAKCAEAVIWFIKYRFFTALPKQMQSLQIECEEIEYEIEQYRKKIASSVDIASANRFVDACDKLRIRLARKRRELKYLSNIGSSHQKGNNNQND